MLKINLQLFADDDEIDDTELDENTEVETKDESDEAEESGDETQDDEEPDEDGIVDEEPVKTKPDKVTTKLINVKRQNKNLRDEIATLRKKMEDREQAEKEMVLRQKLTDSGYSDEEVEERINDRKERETLKRELKDLKYGRIADSLASTYPDIYEHLDEFVDIVESSNGKFTLPEVCKAKLSKTSAKEIRTKAEQELLLQKQKAKTKQISTGEQKSEPTIILSVKHHHLNI